MVGRFDLGLRKKSQGYVAEEDSSEGLGDTQRVDEVRVSRAARPFRAEFVIGQLVMITEDSFKILVENGAQTLRHDFDYESLEKLAERFLGETVAFVVVNGRLTKVKPL